MAVTAKAGSHLAMLDAACARSSGPIIEIGAGRWSTPFLLAVALETGRPLVTVETDARWAPRASHRHQVFTTLETGVAAFAHYGVALVDGLADQRAAAVLALLPKCDYIVVHDTERLASPETSDEYPGLERALATARYRRDDRARVPWTTVVSDLIGWQP